MIDMTWCVWRQYDGHDSAFVVGSMIDMTGCVWREYDIHDTVCVEGV